jgi:hypothetical protein
MIPPEALSSAPMESLRPPQVADRRALGQEFWVLNEMIFYVADA